MAASLGNLKISHLLSLVTKVPPQTYARVAAVHTSRILPEAHQGSQKTHTGQEWSEEDTRNVRFSISPKQTNTRWAIDLIAQVPPKIVTTRVVACEGDKTPALGHPKVYINLDTHEPVSCIYCGLRYQLKEGHHHH